MNPAENKANALAFYDLMFNRCEPRAAIERYVGDVYIQHNPHVGDGKEAFIAYFERMAIDYPGKVTHFKRAIAEGELVVLHCHQIWPGSDDYAGMDIFRFDESGKIVEHWDVLQIISGSSLNPLIHQKKQAHTSNGNDAQRLFREVWQIRVKSNENCSPYLFGQRVVKNLQSTC